MKIQIQQIRKIFSTKGFKKTFKIVGFFLIGLFSLVLIFAIGLRIYFESNKTEIVSKINTQINNNILGEAKIGDIGYKFLIGFPNVTVVLRDVELKDSLYKIHKRPVLKAGEIEVRLNVLRLLEKEVDIHKIVIINATIDLFKDKNGVSNSNIFKPKKKKKKSDTTTAIDEVILNNVAFISENQQRNKLFKFQIYSLKSPIDYTDEGWKTNLKLSAFAHSMAFNSKKGSFIKNKKLEGKLAVHFSKPQNKISVSTDNLGIGDDDFAIKANFNVGKGNSLFAIDIKTQIKWSNAYNLLSTNISSKLKKFDLQKPLQASCVIKGDMKVQGDPEIVVHAQIREDVLKSSYGAVEKCSFNGKFTNNYKIGLGYNDFNSAVIITDFKGEYKKINISIPSAIINNLKKPVATGKFNSEYDVVNLGSFINPNFIKFIDGKAKVQLDFKVDIVDLKLNKPYFTGDIDLKSASFYYKPKNVTFQKTDVKLHFTEEALLIQKIKFQNKVNTVFMEGKVDNFLNLYYDDPEKMVVYWKIHSPFLDIKQIIGLLTYKDKSVPEKKVSNKNASNELHEVLDKSQVNIDFSVDKMRFNTMIGNNFKVNIKADKRGLYVNNGAIKGVKGGSFTFDAQLMPQGKLLLFKTNVNLKDGEISNFLASFNNFGVKSFKPRDISGTLSLATSLSGSLNENRELMVNSVTGSFNYDIKNGTFKNFQPLKKIGKIVFPNRNLSNITFSDLYAQATINSGKVTVKELKVTSNVLNLDVHGVYSLTNTGTNLAVKIPLRNPKDDYKIVDKNEREALRYKGIVVNLLVVDGENGETKIKLGKPTDDKSMEEKPVKEKKSKRNKVL